MRALLIERQRGGRAFWLLPEADEDILVFAAGGEACGPLLRPHHPQWFEWIGSGERDNDASSLAALVLPAGARVFSATELPAVARLKKIAAARMGIFEATVRERMQARAEGAQMAAVLCLIEGESDPRLRPHPAFPPPLGGHLYVL